MPRNNQSGRGKQSAPGNRMEAAATLAVQALAFLAEDPARIGRFLAISGIDPETLRRAAAQPDFLAGVLSYIAEDERMIVAFAEHSGIAPSEVDRARQTLAGADWERDVP